MFPSRVLTATAGFLVSPALLSEGDYGSQMALCPAPERAGFMVRAICEAAADVTVAIS